MPQLYMYLYIHIYPSRTPYIAISPGPLLDQDGSQRLKDISRLDDNSMGGCFRHYEKIRYLPDVVKH